MSLINPITVQPTEGGQHKPSTAQYVPSESGQPESTPRPSPPEGEGEREPTPEDRPTRLAAPASTTTPLRGERVVTGDTTGLGPIQGWLDRSGKTGEGIYLLTGYGERTGNHGNTYLGLALEDAHGCAIGFVWPEARKDVTCSATPMPVAVTGTLNHFKDQVQIKVYTLAPIDPERVPCATALLPRRWCPEAALPALERLAQFEQSLPYPLDGFLRRILLDPALGVPFLRCRASGNHHHHDAGGLLIHSTEMLDLASELAHRMVADDPWSPWLAQVGYLLHDLGKLRSVGERERPPLAFVVPHETLAAEMLAPHLAWLEHRDPTLAAGLRYIFFYLAQPAKVRGATRYAAADVVAMLDQASAGSYNHRDLAYLVRSSSHTSQRPRQWVHRTATRSQPMGPQRYGRAFRA